MMDDELKQVPRRYRWLLRVLLRIPNPRFPFFILKRLAWVEGVFWAIVIPIFLILYFFFSIWLSTFLAWRVDFPWNIATFLLIPALFFVFFVRVELERTILWWKHLNSSPKEWNISKTVAELEEIFRKQKNRR